ncbi:hypothetical protein CEXT_653171 [Caerostris extrusa]|uniref:Uncharacterized protein n=1 Tax=Caerostris extrusa TaxID=172846 RepID=A0AAV4WB58_CAEEX|nr:hypothetical protein CEXT_653171 [Caerostris extrusa]
MAQWIPLDIKDVWFGNLSPTLYKSDYHSAELEVEIERSQVPCLINVGAASCPCSPKRDDHHPVSPNAICLASFAIPPVWQVNGLRLAINENSPNSFLLSFRFEAEERVEQKRGRREEKKSVRIHPCNLGRRELDTHSNAAWNVSDGRTRGKKGEGAQLRNKARGIPFSFLFFPRCALFLSVEIN